MPTRTPKEYMYKQNNAVLYVGYDETGRLFSRIEKNGIVIAKGMYIRMPSAQTLEKQGWERYE